MDKELEKYYTNYFDLFYSEGWKQFIEELQDRKDIHQIENLEDATALHTTKGELRILNMVIGLQNYIEQAYEDNLQESQP